MKSFLSAANRLEPTADEPTADDIVRIFQSESGEIRSGAGPIGSRRAVLLAAALFVSLIAIAGSFQVDRVVTSIFGEIVTIEPTVVMQPFDQSIIKTINVEEGSRAKKGQLLATLDPTFAASSVGALRLQIASLDPQIARCEAELAQRPFVYVPGGGPGAAQYAALQHSYYEQRKAQYDAQIKSYDAQIAQYEATIRELANDAARYGERVRLNQDIQNMQVGLMNSPAFSRLNLLQATDQATEIKRYMEADKNNIPVTQQLAQAAQQTRDAYIQQWRAQTSQELVTARNARDAAQQQLLAALKHLDVVRFYAPDDAIVLRVAKLSVGSVLQAGDDFIELAMLRSPVEAEIGINPVDIGFVRPGDRVVLKLDPYNYVEHGWAEGSVRWISAGTYTTTPTTGTSGPVPTAGTSPGTSAVPSNPGNAAVPGQQSGTGEITTPFYKARISITNVKFKDVPKDARLYPGATLTADIRVGTRSTFWYLFSGIAAGFGQAMREP
jgi:HlyD family secretion protein